MKRALSLMSLAFALATCQDKLLYYFYHYVYLWGGPH
jgi:hypothetical protein